VQPSNEDGMVAAASCQPSLVQRIAMLFLLRGTVTTPGETTFQFPSESDRVQFAPVVGGVVMATLCEPPFMTDAHAPSDSDKAAIAATRIIFMILIPRLTPRLRARPDIDCRLSPHRLPPPALESFYWTTAISTLIARFT